MAELMSLLSVVIGMFTGSAIRPGLECKDIIDIYYARNKENLAYDRRCRYTKTLLCERDCANYFISRKYYDEWADKYIKEGIEPPFPKRSDTDHLFPAYTYQPFPEQ